MEITEVRITLRNEERLKAFANVTFDHEFVIRGLKVINGNSGYFVSMPSRKRSDGTHQDIAHPINTSMRKKIEDRVLAAYEDELKKAAGGRSSTEPSEDAAGGASEQSASGHDQTRPVSMAPQSAEDSRGGSDETSPSPGAEV